MKIELSKAPSQGSNKYAQTAFSSAETNIIDSEITKMQNKGIIEKATHESNEILSNIFTRPKKDGTHRVILNVAYYHFKIDSLTTIINLVDKNCFIACIDLKDAYYFFRKKTDLYIFSIII